MMAAVNVRWAFNTKLFLDSSENWTKCLISIQQDERNRLSPYVFKNSIVSSLSGRLLLRRWAHKCLGIEWRDVLLQRSERGRPYLVWPEGIARKDVDVNISHQGDWVVLAACEGGVVGSDVMKVQYSRIPTISEFFHCMRRQFTKQEWQSITHDPSDTVKLERFYRHWCLKESILKAVGVGVTFQLQDISFCVNNWTLHEDTVVNDTTVDVYNRKNLSWRFEESKLDSDTCVAIAYRPCPALSLGAQEERKLEELLKGTEYDDFISFVEDPTGSGCSIEAGCEGVQGMLFERLTMAELLDGAQEVSVPVTPSELQSFINKQTAHWL